MRVWGKWFGVVSAWASMGVAVAGTADCGKSNASELGLAESCTLNSDCDTPLVCVFSRCHTVCATDRDCPTGQRCVSSAVAGGPVGYVCQLPIEEACSETSACQSGQVCGGDKQCRGQCTSTGSTPCATGQFCLTGETASSCYAATDPNDEPTLMSAGILAADGAVLVDASTGVLPSTGSDGGPDSTLASSGGGGSSSSGASGGSGSGSSSGAVGPLSGCEGGTRLPSGGCDLCPEPSTACNGNGACVSGDAGYTCACYGGYVHDPSSNDPTTCVIVDSCLANDTCSPAYPCIDTAPPGQACQGQYAAWHVADSTAGPDAGATVAPHYSINGDGTITDAVTTLTWQQDAQANTGQVGCAVSPDAGADASFGTTCTVGDSENYCSWLRVGGYSDWRLPTLIELESLIDYSAETPPYLSSAFLPAPNTMYWTSSIVQADSTGNASFWGVDFSSQSTVSITGGQDNAGAVRCVRGTGIFPTTPAAHYTVDPGAVSASVGDADVTGDTVTDDYTGLTWERTPSGGMLSANAAAYCAALGGFRVPTAKELMTLVNPTHYSPAIDAVAFPNTPFGVPYWSSTQPQPPATGSYWVVDFQNGSVSSVGAGTCSGECSYAVRCVK